MLQTIQMLRVGQRLGRCVFVIGLERLVDFFRLVAEIEDERIFLARTGSVQA